jgi:phosphatidylserine decarboxylase
MRIPLTRYGWREAAIYGALGLALTALVVVAAPSWWWLGAVPLALTVWVFSFFRDPERQVPQGAWLLLAPADGRVTAIETIDAPPELGAPGRALRVSIFLSVFNCHLNRSPCAARVQRVVYRRGRFLNALRGASAGENEQNILVLRPDAVETPILVRQVAGIIARRIVCRAADGDHLSAGQRFGMIKFGSRTDLVVPEAAPVELRINVGDRVKAGLTVLGQFR